MIDTDKYYETRDIHPDHLTEFENAMNEGTIERRHCLWALTEVKQLREVNEKLQWYYEKCIELGCVAGVHEHWGIHNGLVVCEDCGHWDEEATLRILGLDDGDEDE